MSISCLRFSLEDAFLVRRAGDTITVIDTSDPDWWQGKCMGKVGFFPSKYVAKLHPGERALQVVHPIQVAETGPLADLSGGPSGGPQVPPGQQPTQHSMTAKFVRDQVISRCHDNAPLDNRAARSKARTMRIPRNALQMIPTFRSRLLYKWVKNWKVVEYLFERG